MRRFFGKPKKNRCFLKTELLDVTFGEKPENRKKNRKKPGRKTGKKKTKKNRYFTKIKTIQFRAVSRELEVLNGISD